MFRERHDDNLMGTVKLWSINLTMPSRGIAMDLLRFFLPQETVAEDLQGVLLSLSASAEAAPRPGCRGQ
jgi:hypothetical protein